MQTCIMARYQNAIFKKLYDHSISGDWPCADVRVFVYGGRAAEGQREMETIHKTVVGNVPKGRRVSLPFFSDGKYIRHPGDYA